MPYFGKPLPLPAFSWSSAALFAGLLVAVITDLRTRRIPNVLTASMVSVGFVLPAAGLSEMSLGAALLGCFVGLVLMLPGHVLGATGGGDVKLMAAVGSIVGPVVVVNAFLFTAVAGGVMAMIVAMQRRRLAVTLAGTGRMLSSPADARREVQSAAPASRFAYGPAIAVGSVLAALMG